MITTIQLHNLQIFLHFQISVKSFFKLILTLSINLLKKLSKQFLVSDLICKNLKKLTQLSYES